jgi:hypothetical protein
LLESFPKGFLYQVAKQSYAFYITFREKFNTGQEYLPQDVVYLTDNSTNVTIAKAGHAMVIV